MKHGVAVRANGHEIAPRIRGVPAPCLGYRSKMMDVDEATSPVAIALLEVDIADLAAATEMPNTGPACSGVPFVPADQHLKRAALEADALIQFVGEQTVIPAARSSGSLSAVHADMLCRPDRPVPSAPSNELA